MILPHHGKWPEIHETAWIAPSADVIGEVKIGEHSSVWFQVVVRGDVHTIQIGNRTNIQDQTMLHVTRKKFSLKIGDEVTIGHRATLHGCTIGNRVLVGMGAIILDGATISDDSIVAAGALVSQGKTFPSGVLIMGAPAKVARELTEAERAFLKQSAENYVGDSTEYKRYVRGPSRLNSETKDLEDLTTEEGFGDEFDDLG